MAPGLRPLRPSLAGTADICLGSAAISPSQSVSAVETGPTRDVKPELLLPEAHLSPSSKPACRVWWVARKVGERLHFRVRIHKTLGGPRGKDIKHEGRLPLDPFQAGCLDRLFPPLTPWSLLLNKACSDLSCLTGVLRGPK